MIHATGIDHITITVKELRLSEPFYEKLMCFLGLKKVFSEYGFVGWKNSNFNFYISEAEAPYKNENFSKYRPGLNHLSFKAESKDDVDTLYLFLKKKKIPILESPKQPKRPFENFYFVAFEDPDGIKVEFGYSA